MKAPNLHSAEGRQDCHNFEGKLFVAWLLVQDPIPSCFIASSDSHKNWFKDKGKNTMLAKLNLNAISGPESPTLPSCMHLSQRIKMRVVQSAAVSRSRALT